MLPSSIVDRPSSIPFADFPTLARLLGYLRACVVSTKVDALRMQTAGDHMLSEQQVDAAATPEQAVLADLGRSALWQTVMALTVNTTERITLIESFVYGLPPRAIRARHPQLFPDVAAVYSAKRNLIERLRRNHDLQRLREDFVAA